MNTTSQARSSEKTPRWVLFLWSVVAIIVVSWVSTPMANAYHHDHGTDRLHNRYIHYTTTGGQGVNDEDYCVQSFTTRMTFATALARVKRTLTELSPRWDGTGNYRIDLYAKGSQCSDYGTVNETTRTEYIPGIEYQYRVRNNNADISACGADNVSCVTHHPAVKESGAAHGHFEAEISFLDVDNILSNTESVWQAHINHETGHIIGLRDPGSHETTKTCTASIMHIPWYCGVQGYTNSYPSTGDFNSVVHIMDNTD